ncbi:MAG TPA: MaoC family dehydratase N-terminal domain-containing protein [Casimicrobiaceae bacterium]|nr:MaoC family dehydratase N-terminal domain-containing protein [Casimicrobiaceae bacterium]
MVDTASIGRRFPPLTVAVDAERLRLFARATGETRREYIDEAAARAAGHLGLPAPPTYIACLSLDEADPFSWLREIGADIAQVLHGAQGFRYFVPVHAGDRLTFVARIANVLQKRSGSRAFVVKVTDITNQNGVRVAEMRTTIVVRGNSNGDHV